MIEFEVQKYLDSKQIGESDKEGILTEAWMSSPPPSVYTQAARIARRGVDIQGLYYKGSRIQDGSLMFTLHSPHDEAFSVVPDTLNYLDIKGLDTIRDFASCMVGSNTLLGTLNTLGVFHIMDPSTHSIMAVHIESAIRDEIRVRCGRNSYLVKQFDEVSRMAGTNILLLASTNLMKHGQTLVEASKQVQKIEKRSYVPPLPGTDIEEMRTPQSVCLLSTLGPRLTNWFTELYKNEEIQVDADVMCTGHNQFNVYFFLEEQDHDFQLELTSLFDLHNADVVEDNDGEVKIYTLLLPDLASHSDQIKDVIVNMFNSYTQTFEISYGEVDDTWLYVRDSLLTNDISSCGLNIQLQISTFGVGEVLISIFP